MNTIRKGEIRQLLIILSLKILQLYSLGRLKTEGMTTSICRESLSPNDHRNVATYIALLYRRSC